MKLMDLDLAEILEEIRKIIRFVGEKSDGDPWLAVLGAVYRYRKFELRGDYVFEHLPEPSKVLENLTKTGYWEPGLIEYVVFYDHQIRIARENAKILT